MTEVVITDGAMLNGFAQEHHLPQLRKDMSPTERRTNLRLIASTVAQIGDKCRMIDGEVLYEIRENQYWRDYGYISFDEYCAKELGYTTRTVNYRIAVYKKFVVEIGAPPEILQQLEWSKAKELLPVVDAGNFQDVINAAADMSLAEVITYARQKQLDAQQEQEELEAEDIPKEPKPKFETFRVELPPDEYEALIHALDLAAQDHRSEKRSTQLLAIAHSYIAESARTNPEKLRKLQQGIQALESAFNVRLDVQILHPEDYGINEEMLAESTR